MEYEQLLLTVTSLIASKSEGEYWDFKRDFHENKASLLHDILCMANNLTSHDGMIIFGVQDGSFEVIGVDESESRRDLNYYINFLKEKEFAGGIRSKIEFHTLSIDGKEVDVLLVKNTDKTPYYICKDFSDRGKTVRANYIYTRVGESNTDINRSADIDQIEMLWAKRLKVPTKTPRFKLELLGFDEGNEVVEAIHPYEYSYPSGLIRAEPYDEEDALIDGVTVEDIRRYNAELPDMELMEEYNRQQRLYEDVQENCHKVFLSLTNTGSAPGTSIYVTLFLPSELLVYSEYDCSMVHKPKKLDMPEDPVERALEAEYRKKLGGYLGRFPGLEATLIAAEQYNQLYTLPKPLSVLPLTREDFSITREHDQLEVHIKDLLHTRSYECDDFFLILTKRGEFEIQYEIMCEEFEKPQTGGFVITVE